MKTKRRQVSVTRVGGWWVVRPRVRVVIDGKVETVQRAIRIACAEGRSKRAPHQVLELASGEVRRIKGSSKSPLLNLKVGDFFKSVFLPHAEESLRPSTYEGYKGLWKRYVPQAFASISLREIRASHVQRLLEDNARVHKISKRTLQHLKHLLSGVFRYAAQQDQIDGNRNPVTLAAIPTFADSGSDTYAYSLDEVASMARVLTEPARTVVLVAAYSGLRAGEIRGLTWDAYEPAVNNDSLGLLHVRRSVWRKHTTDPKTEKSRASVPVIPQLATAIESWHFACGNPSSGPMFQNAAGTPLSLDSLYWRKVRKPLECAKLPWHGWHGFRRGLASNLNRLGVDDSVIQAILRHSHISVTQACYIKTAKPEIVAAMRHFSESLGEKCSSSVFQNQADPSKITLQ